MSLRKRISSHATNTVYVPAVNNMIKESTCTCNTQSVNEYDYQECSGEYCSGHYCPSNSSESYCSSYDVCPSNCYCYSVEKCVGEVVTCSSVCKPQTPAYIYVPYNNSTSCWGKYSGLAVITQCDSDCKFDNLQQL